MRRHLRTCATPPPKTAAMATATISLRTVNRTRGSLMAIVSGASHEDRQAGPEYPEHDERRREHVGQDGRREGRREGSRDRGRQAHHPTDDHHESDEFE